MAATALAYSQVNASRGGCVSGDQSSWRPVPKSGPAGLFSVQCSPKGHGRQAKTRRTRKAL